MGLKILFIRLIKFLFKSPFVIILIILVVFLQSSLRGGYTFASNIRNGETIFKNVCASCHVKGGLVVTKGYKSLKFSDLEKRGIADSNSIQRIANEGIGNMKGYKNKLKGQEDKILSEWIIKQSKTGWKK